MKNILKILFSVLIVLPASSCNEDEIQVFEGENNIYFQHKKYTNATHSSLGMKSELTYQGRLMKLEVAGVDSAGYVQKHSMAFVNTELRRDTTFIPVMVAGKIAPYDRDFAYRIDSTNLEGAAVEGQHYKILRAFIPAEKTLGGIVVEMLRDNIEASRDYRIDFALLANDNFNVNYRTIEFSPNDTTLRSVLNQTFYFTDGLTQPPRWTDAYMGPFSSKKMFLLHDVLLLDWEDLYGTQTSIWWAAAANMLRVWLEDYKVQNGTYYTEEDGSEMVAGAYA